MDKLKIKNYSESEFIFIPEGNSARFTLFFLNNLTTKSDDKFLLSKSEFISNYNLISDFLSQENCDLDIDDAVYDFVENQTDYEEIDAEPLAWDLIEKKLNKEKFKRELKSFQKRNVQKLCALNAGANFSVPGSGKTTDALAFFTFKKEKNSKLLIVSPINAYLSWEDEISACLGEENELIKLRGDLDEIEKSLNSKEEFFWINYDSLRNSSKLEVVKNFLISNKVTLILDESHRSKGEQISKCISRIAVFPQNKLILTGTPMPQAAEDLDSQFSFLYPKHNIGLAEQFIEAFKPFYVRTNDKDLGLKPLVEKLTPVTLYPGHEEFYDKYIDQELKEGASLQKVMQAKDIKSAYMRYLRFMSNPMSISEFIFEVDSKLASKIQNEGLSGVEGDGAKLDTLITRAKELIMEGNKVLIWSSFVSNVEKIALRLSHFGSEFIHGGVKSESSIDGQLDDDWPEEEQDSREAKIKRFKESEDCMVLVANPAAAAESMSLHTVCDHALYLDRDYNAGRYLQSQKRIHRLTEGEDRIKTIEIFYANVRASIDVLINKRLAEKCHKMFEFLNESEISENWVGTSEDLYFSNLSKDFSKEFDEEMMLMHREGTNL